MKRFTSRLARWALAPLAVVATLGVSAAPADAAAAWHWAGYAWAGTLQPIGRQVTLTHIPFRVQIIGSGQCGEVGATLWQNEAGYLWADATQVSTWCGAGPAAVTMYLLVIPRWWNGSSWVDYQCHDMRYVRNPSTQYRMVQCSLAALQPRGRPVSMTVIAGFYWTPGPGVAPQAHVIQMSKIGGLRTAMPLLEAVGF